MAAENEQTLLLTVGITSVRGDPEYASVRLWPFVSVNEVLNVSKTNVSNAPQTGRKR